MPALTLSIVISAVDLPPPVTVTFAGCQIFHDEFRTVVAVGNSRARARSYRGKTDTRGEQVSLGHRIAEFDFFVAVAVILFLVE